MAETRNAATVSEALLALTEETEKILAEQNDLQARRARMEEAKEKLAQLDPKHNEQDRQTYDELSQKVKRGGKILEQDFKDLAQKAKEHQKELEDFSALFPDKEDEKVADGHIKVTMQVVDECMAEAEDLSKEAFQRIKTEVKAKGEEAKEKRQEVLDKAKESVKDFHENTIEPKRQSAYAALSMVVETMKKTVEKVRTAFRNGEYKVAKAAFIDMGSKARSINLARTRYDLETEIGAHEKEVARAKITLEHYQNLAKERALKENNGIGIANFFKKVAGVHQKEKPIREYLTTAEKLVVEAAASRLSRSNAALGKSIDAYTASLNREISDRSKEMALNTRFKRQSLNEAILEQQAHSVYDKVVEQFKKIPSMEECAFVQQGITLRKDRDGNVQCFDGNGNDAKAKLMEMLKHESVAKDFVNSLRDNVRIYTTSHDNEILKNESKEFNVKNKDVDLDER